MFGRFRLTAIIISGAVLVAALAAIAAGCGSSSSNTEAITVSPECAAAPTVIPKSQGRPMMVEFFNPQ